MRTARWSVALVSLVLAACGPEYTEDGNVESEAEQNLPTTGPAAAAKGTTIDTLDPLQADSAQAGATGTTGGAIADTSASAPR